MEGNRGLRLIAPKIVPVLDPEFRPAVLANRRFADDVKASGSGVPVRIAVERDTNSVSRFETRVFASDDSRADANFVYLERILKFLLWAKGGAKIYFDGPKTVGAKLRRYYDNATTGRFDAEIMGNKIYERPFMLVTDPDATIPQEEESTSALGRNLDGCRIGFDLGASDRKAAAVIDGEAVFSEEVEWDPRNQSDPEWHFNEIMHSLKRAAEHLPRVDAIGGSSAGVYVNNLVKVASLFRGIPEDRFKAEVGPLFLRIQKAWNNVPFQLVNDGEVTALAGSMALNDSGVLGIAMGSSEAAGYVNMDGNITPWLNELAFAPVDYHPDASVDEWSGDYGCGVRYFSQQCVGRLINPAGIDIDNNLPLPEQLVLVQELMAKGDERARKIYETIGTYLGYTLPHYADFYDFKHVLILGRVTTGVGGEVILEQARHVLDEEFPEQAALNFHIPDEKEKRHGQAIAAASLPAIK